MTIEHKTGTSLVPVGSNVIVLDPYTPSPSEEAFVHQFGRKIVGQPAAEQIASMVHNAYSNPFRDKTRPIGVYYLVGPSRTGKSYTGEVLAELMHGTQEALTRLQCGDYEEDHQVADLRGAPPGYIGFKDVGKLKLTADDEDPTTPISNHNLMRLRMKSGKEIDIVLLEEFEKSSYDFYKFWMGAFDKGKVKLSDGRIVDFTNTVFILTSNLGMERLEDLAKGSIGFTNGGPKKVTEDDVKGVVDEEMKRRYKPEFRNRLDAVVIFRPFSAEELGKIVVTELTRIQDRISKQAPVGKRFKLVCDEGARKQLLIQTGTNVAELKRVMQKELLTPLGRLFNLGKLPPACTVTVSYNAGLDRFDFGMLPGTAAEVKAQEEEAAKAAKAAQPTDTNDGAKPKAPLLLEGPKDGKTPKDPKGDPKKAALFQPLTEGSRSRGLDRYLIQTQAKSLNEVDDRGEEIMNYVLEILDLDIEYEATTHRAPYRFDLMVWASEAQMKMLKKLMPFITYSKRGE
jgi:hypothetical protein